MKSALEAYDMDIDYIKFLTEESNMFFKIKDSTGKYYAAKLYDDYSSNLEESNIEMYFLNHMCDSTSIDVPTPIKNTNGDYITEVNPYNMEIKSRIAIYEWFYGKSLDGHENTDYFYEIGKIMAEMHNSCEHLKLPDGMSPKKIDKVFYYSGDELFYKDKPMLIHADFNPWNIWLDKKVKITDFEDACLGFPIHDIAILFLLQYKRKLQ